MLKTYVTVCADVEKFRLTEDGAKEQARILSLALNPEPAEVYDTRTRELVSFFVDGQEYPPSLVSLTRTGTLNTELKEASSS